MNSHISVAETHTHAHVRACMHTVAPPRIIHVPNCCVSPVLSFFKVNVAGMILPIITWVFGPRPRCLCAMWNQLCEKKKEKENHIGLSVWGGTGGGGGVGGGWALWRKTLLLHLLKTGSFWPRRNVTEVERRYLPAHVRGLKLHTAPACLPPTAVRKLGCQVSVR